MIGVSAMANNQRNKFSEAFHQFSNWSAGLMGSPGAFVLASCVIITWAVTGPFFHFSDTWQLVINTSTTIVTFLMVFLIQNTQNRDARAIHLKLDELLRGVTAARTGLVNLEELPEEDLNRLAKEFKVLQKRAGTDEQTGELEEVEEHC